MNTLKNTPGNKRKGLWTGVAMLALALGIGAMQGSTFAAVPSSIGQEPGSITRPSAPTQPFGALASNLLAAMPAQGAGHSQSQNSITTPFDCSRIKALHLDQQMNLHAGDLVAACAGEVRPKVQPPDLSEIAKRLSPMSFGGPDVNTITGAETFPHLTQSESFIGVNGQTVVVAYNDTRKASISALERKADALFPSLQEMSYVRSRIEGGYGR